MSQTPSLAKDFLWKRLHSLTGLFLTLYLIEHLFINSQAALLIGEDGWGFIRAVNAIHDLPYLPFIELFLLGGPIALHAYLGIHYLWSSQQNSYGSQLERPLISDNPRNRAYTWQRWTSWILLFGIIAHVLHMRFIEYPEWIKSEEGHQYYALHLNSDPGLVTLADRLGFHLYEEAPGEMVAVTPSFGMAELLLVRETFKMPIMLALYTIFVLSACFHGFNGLWSFMITWGVTLNERAQLMMKKIAMTLMGLVAFWGISAIWLTYWVNLNS